MGGLLSDSVYSYDRSPYISDVLKESVKDTNMTHVGGEFVIGGVVNHKWIPPHKSYTDKNGKHVLQLFTSMLRFRCSHDSLFVDDIYFKQGCSINHLSVIDDTIIIR